MMVVQFAQKYDRFNPGERANFPDGQAQSLLDAKIAVKPAPKKVVTKG